MSDKQVALVTGASRGIGASIAQQLAREGFIVIGTATSDDGAAKISQALSAFPGCRGANLNVTDATAGETLIDAIVKEHGGLQVLVNNAGITRDQLAMRMKDDDWDAVADTNLRAVFRMSRAVIRPMMKQRYGRIISITSVVGASGNPGQANYAAAKAGVAGMTRALARELGSRGITVNCVAPGFIETDMTAAHVQGDARDALLKQIPLGRIGQAHGGLRITHAPARGQVGAADQGHELLNHLGRRVAHHQVVVEVAVVDVDVAVKVVVVVVLATKVKGAAGQGVVVQTQPLPVGGAAEHKRPVLVERVAVLGVVAQGIHGQGAQASATEVQRACFIAQAVKLFSIIALDVMAQRTCAFVAQVGAGAAV